jgi:cysteine desulfurase/selenocysteine lyase
MMFFDFFCTFAQEKKTESDMFNVNKVREEFPILGREVYGKPLVYLDNAATTQKPLCVLDAMRDE